MRWQWCEATVNLLLLMGMQNSIATLENSLQFFIKFIIALSYNPATPPLGIYSREMKTSLDHS